MPRRIMTPRAKLRQKIKDKMHKEASEMENELFNSLFKPTISAQSADALKLAEWLDGLGIVDLMGQAPSAAKLAAIARRHFGAADLDALNKMELKNIALAFGSGSELFGMPRKDLVRLIIKVSNDIYVP